MKRSEDKKKRKRRSGGRITYVSYYVRLVFKKETPKEKIKQRERKKRY